MLAPFAPGRAGRIVRRLATAHVRDDPHALWLLAGLAGLVAATLVAAFVDPARLEWLALPHPRIPVRGGIAFLLPAMALPVLVFPHLVHSSDAAAAWVLAGVDLSGREMLSAQRGVARGLIVAPIVVAAALLHLRAGTAVAVALSDLALVTLVAEAVLALVQRFYPVMPFSRARAAEGLELLPVAGLMMPAFAVAAVWMLTGYERLPMWSGRVLTWAVLVVTIQGLRRSLHRTIAGRPLPIETAPR